MKTKLQSLLFCLALIVPTIMFAQQIENKPGKATYVGTPDKVTKVPSIASRRGALVEVDLLEEKEMQDARSAKFDVVPGKGSTGDDALAMMPKSMKNKIPTREPSLVFETASSSSLPTDPAGAVGPNHYVAVTNTAFRIFDKDGNPLTGQLAPNPTIFPDGGCCDLTVSYDNAADRWVLSFLNGAGAGAQIAVSDGPNPVTAGWNTYYYAVVNDYQKLSVWSDGYYMTENTGSANKVHVFDRAAMLAGDANAAIQSFNLPGIVTSNFHAPQALNISNNNTPATGGATIVYMQDDAWGGVSQDHIKLWTIDVDWATPTNSTVSAATQLGIDAGTGTVTPFIGVMNGGSFSNLPQPNGGQAIDALQATMMNQAQFRKFATHNSAVFNFVVDVDGSANNQAGVRWYELRQNGDNQPWTIYQEGTYTAPDNRHAWNASMIMDVQGNIGLGYTSMSSPNSSDANVRVGSYYTGRLSGDALGTMTVAEGTIMAGNANIPSSNRYGDYSKIDVDPSNDKTFWFVNELMNNGRKNVAGVFQIAPDTNNDVGVVSIDTPTTGALTNSESVTVTVYNFGQNDASGFNVTYQVDGGSVVSQAFTGTLASGASQQFTFTQTADLSSEGQAYTINACTVLSGDEDSNNDCTSVSVTNVLANDIGIIAITSPTSGEGLGNETVTVTVENFGTASQSNFLVTYNVDGTGDVTETVAGPIAPGATLNYSFTQTANLSEPGTYSIVASTALANDGDNSNNSTSISVENVNCQSAQSADTPITITASGTPTITSTINVPNDFVINDVNVTINIEHTWAADMDITLTSPTGTVVELTTDNGSNGDNYTNTVFDDEAADPITGGTAPFTGSFQPEGTLADFNNEQSAGDWILTVNDDANQDGGQLLNWSLQLCSSTNLSIEDRLFEEELLVIHEGNDQYTVKLPTTASTEKLSLTVYNTLGQILAFNPIENKSGQAYEYKLDMSYVASGVYLIRVGNSKAGNTKRIIVE